MLNGKEAAKLKRLIRRFANAQEDKSWAGGGDPDNIPDINAEFKEARKALNDYIRSLTDVSESTRP